MNRQKQQNVPKPEAPSSEQSIMNNETPSVQRFGVGTTATAAKLEILRWGVARRKKRERKVFFTALIRVY